MPLRLTSAPVAGIQKQRRSSNRNVSSPFFSSRPRRKPNVQRSEHGYDDTVEKLPDAGASNLIAETAAVKDVAQAIQYISSTMFEELPARAGMNSTRIAEVLNLRRSLPPLASVAHIHTLLNAPTEVEKEIVELVNIGRVRRLIVPGRGSDAAGLGDCLVLASEWDELVQASNDIEQPTKEKFLRILQETGNSSAIPSGTFSHKEYLVLVRAGFLVSFSSLARSSLSVASLPFMPSPMCAAGTATRRTSAEEENMGSFFCSSSQRNTATLFLSLPNTGPYLRLLEAGRSHLLSLLKRSKYREAPLQLLRDQWDGAVELDRIFSVAKRVRGEFSGVLPGRTKKWKDLHGMSFRWALEEALGAGLIELFDTGSVGPGVRCI